MRSLLVGLFGMCVVGSVIAHWQTAPSREDTGKHVDLTASIRLVSQEYCLSGESPIGHDEIRLRVSIRNHGLRPVIVCRKYLGVYYPIVDHILPDGTAGNVAFTWMPDTFGLFDRHYPENLNRDYVMIGPEAGFEFGDSTDVLFRPDSRSSVRGAIDPGTYLVSVKVVTWAAQPQVAASLRRRWKKYGDLFDGYLDSNSIRVNIDPGHSLSECEE
jgi:hypothetical protein